jgi:Squalene-hopene cyclase N-terminal domain
MFGSVLTYVTLRLLGEGPTAGDGSMEKARNWILSRGTATAITSWGKMWLSVSAKFCLFNIFHFSIYSVPGKFCSSPVSLMLSGTWSV